LSFITLVTSLYPKLTFVFCPLIVIVVISFSVYVTTNIV
jgi:hypothetical protein